MQLLPLEKAVEVEIHEKLTKRYAITNLGRFISFHESIEKDGVVLKCSRVDGYRIFRYKYKGEDGSIKNGHKFLYKLVAYHFVPRTSEDQIHVIHLNFDRSLDTPQNLKWVTREEKLAHINTSDRVIESRKKLIEHNIKSDGKKLSVTQVILLKKQLANPNRKTRLKILARQFGISEMQLYRIKSGENWGHIKV